MDGILPLQEWWDKVYKGWFRFEFDRDPALSEDQTKWLEKNNIEQAVWLTLQKSIFPGANPDSIFLAILYCKSRNLDVLKKPCHIVPMNVKDAKTGNYSWRDVIMPGIYEYRITASRSGVYAGQNEPKFGPMIPFTCNGVEHEVPEYCTVTVHKIVQGMKVSFYHTEYFEEICGTKGDGSLNSMWKKRKRGQLAKCAEAGALRKAFPEELGGTMTAEEIIANNEAIIDEKPTNAFSNNITVDNVNKLETLISGDDELEGLLLSGFQVNALSEIKITDYETVITRINSYQEKKA